MPSTPAISCWMRFITVVTSSLRSSRAFRLIWMRPLFGVVLVPSTPMNDDRLSTSLSLRMAAASACCRSDMAANEMLSGASEMPMITPVSCTGKKPLGTTMYR